MAKDMMLDEVKAMLGRSAGTLGQEEEAAIVTRLGEIDAWRRASADEVLLPHQKAMIQQYRVQSNLQTDPFESLTKSELFAELRSSPEQIDQI